jgi:hypothetical protein
MTEGETKAQIEILEFVLESLCKCELNTKGRLFIRLHIRRLKKRLTNDTNRTENSITGNDRNFD